LPRDLEVFKTPKKGWGVRCWHKVYAGDFISEYVGEILTLKDSEARENDEYFFDCRVVPAAARKDSLYSNEDGDADCLNECANSEFLIDGRLRGNATRYINHSCDPNLIVQCVYVAEEKLPRIALFAWKDIEPGEELSYDYAQEQNSEEARFECHCGAPRCKSRQQPQQQQPQQPQPQPQQQPQQQQPQQQPQQPQAQQLLQQAQEADDDARDDHGNGDGGTAAGVAAEGHTQAAAVAAAVAAAAEAVKAAAAAGAAPEVIAAALNAATAEAKGGGPTAGAGGGGGGGSQ
jgi:pyruvate/2-oxoglutarate dehydrogenase complex dihydrolipoamide acyltransferase (E2) component